MDIGVQPHGMVQFEMSSLDPENYPVRPVKPQQEHNIPDVIAVRVQTEWRIEEVEHINVTLSGAERKAALCALLEQETQFISSIEQHRMCVGTRNRDKAMQAFLNKEHKCKLTQDIVDLIDREVDLLMRGIQKCNLEGLKKRITSLFLQYIKTPAFNPQVPRDPADLKKNIYLCCGCNEYQSSTDFALKTDASSAGLCHRCMNLDNEARRREDFSLYKNILMCLQESEAECSPEPKITYLLQEQDLRYLVDLLWGAQSALSSWKDLHDLLLVWWEKHLDWSPWNCILLTKDEAAAHLKLENIEKAYDVVVIRNVKQKHTLARNYFSQIPAMAECLHDAEIQPSALSNLLASKPITNR
ncbi:hypothetical protein cypCar_00024367 [Cyprinus carpio]|nr:hypothetical protein cypCar_00024367 [Cyprinus carpio]